MASDTEPENHQQPEEEQLSSNGRASGGGGGEAVTENGNELPIPPRPTTPPPKPTNSGAPTSQAQAQLTSPSSSAGSSDNENDDHNNLALGSSSADISQDEDASADAGSELLTSPPLPPSVTSPPYWAHGHNTPNRGLLGGGGTRHARTMSSVSAESDLPPGAITLQDNEHDDGPDGANVYGRDRNRACWARKVDIVDHILVNGGTANIGAFVVWNIRVETLNVRTQPPGFSGWELVGRRDFG